MILDKYIIYFRNPKVIAVIKKKIKQLKQKYFNYKTIANCKI